MSVTSTPPISAEQMAALPPELRALLQSVIEHYERRSDALQREVAELKAELQAMRKKARNSSLPPSTEHSHTRTSSGGRGGESGEAESDEVPAKARNKKNRCGQNPTVRPRSRPPPRCQKGAGD